MGICLGAIDPDWSNVLGQFAVFFKDRLPNL